MHVGRNNTLKMAFCKVTVRSNCYPPKRDHRTNNTVSDFQNSYNDRLTSIKPSCFTYRSPSRN